MAWPDVHAVADEVDVARQGDDGLRDHDRRRGAGTDAKMVANRVSLHDACLQCAPVAWSPSNRFAMSSATHMQ